MYHMATDMAWNLPGNIIYDSIHRRRKKEHTEEREQANITRLLEFHLARVRLVTYLLLTSKVRDNRGIQLRMWLK